MYVCVCKGVTDHQIQQAIEKGMNTRKKLQQCFGVGSDCGKCSQHVKQMLDNTALLQPIIPTTHSIPALSTI